MRAMPMYPLGKLLNLTHTRTDADRQLPIRLHHLRCRKFRLITHELRITLSEVAHGEGQQDKISVWIRTNGLDLGLHQRRAVTQNMTTILQVQNSDDYCSTITFNESRHKPTLHLMSWHLQSCAQLATCNVTWDVCQTIVNTSGTDYIQKRYL